MSLPWFRVDVEFSEHPKVHHLEALLGPLAGWYVVRLWTWTARYASRGRIERRGDERATVAGASLERSCGWSGDAGKLVEAFLEVGILDRTTEGDLEVHDWWEKQRTIVEKAEKDRERLRASRVARGIVARTSGGRSRDGRAGVAGDVTLRDETKEDHVEQARPVDLESRLTDDEFQVFEHWRVRLGHPKAKPTAERKRLIAKQLKVYSREDLQRAIDGCAKSPHHMGQNDRNTRYDDLELILRDAKHIEVFMGFANVA